LISSCLAIPLTPQEMGMKFDGAFPVEEFFFCKKRIENKKLLRNYQFFRQNRKNCVII
jgi:hypothetical protein